MKPENYIYIARWGRMMGSFDNYIKAQQENAAVMGAPLNAIFWASDFGRWMTMSDLDTPTTLRVLAVKL